MSAVQSKPWVTGWTADNPLKMGYNLAPAGSPYVPGALAGFVYRDLGLTKASYGKLSAQLVRLAGKPEAAFSDWRAYDVDFHFFYIRKGSCRMENEAGQSMKLDTGVAAWQPPLLRHRLYDFSPDFEMYEMFGQAEPKAIVGRNAALPARASEFAGQKGQYLFETPESFVQGAGPRKFFLYRDLGTRGPTDGRIHIHIVHATQEMTGEGGTGWHVHSMRQLFWVFAGSAGFTIDADPNMKRVVAGDSVCLGDGMKHNVPNMAADYRLIEVCIPAEYSTTDVTAPAGQ